MQDLRLSYVFLNQALTDRNLGWRGFWNSEMWTFFKLQPVFIESMMHAICGPIWKYINLKKVFKCTYCKAIFIFFFLFSMFNGFIEAFLFRLKVKKYSLAGYCMQMVPNICKQSKFTKEKDHALQMEGFILSLFWLRFIKPRKIL